MCKHRLGCPSSRSGAGPLVLDRCSHLCRRLLLRLRIGREKVSAELLQQPKGLCGLGWRRWTGSGGVWLVVELVMLWESVEEVTGLACSLEERIGTGRSSYCLSLGVSVVGQDVQGYRSLFACIMYCVRRCSSLEGTTRTSPITCNNDSGHVNLVHVP